MDSADLAAHHPRRHRLIERHEKTLVPFGDLQGFVHFVARESGAFLGRIATDGSAVRAAPIRLAEGLLVQTQNGGLYALNLQ